MFPLRRFRPEVRLLAKRQGRMRPKSRDVAALDTRRAKARADPDLLKAEWRRRLTDEKFDIDNYIGRRRRGQSHRALLSAVQRVFGLQASPVVRLPLRFLSQTCREPSVTRFRRCQRRRSSSPVGDAGRHGQPSALRTVSV